MRSSARRRPSSARALRGARSSASSKATLASLARPSSSSRAPSESRCSSRWAARRRVLGLGLERALALLLARDGAQRVGVEAARERFRLRQERQRLVPGAAAAEFLRPLEQPPHLAAGAPREPRGLGRLRLAAALHELGEERGLADGALLLLAVEGLGGGHVLLLLEQAHAQVVVRQVVHELQPVGLHVGPGRRPQPQRLAQVLDAVGEAPLGDVVVPGLQVVVVPLARGPGRARESHGQDREQDPGPDAQPTSRTSRRCGLLARSR